MNHFDFERQFRALPQPHAIFSRDLNFVAVNPAFELSSGVTADDVVGRGVFEMFPGTGVSGERLRASLDRVIETGERSSIAFLRYDIPDPNAENGQYLKRYWSLTYSPILDASGTTEFILATIVDVTQLADENERATEQRKLSSPEQHALVENAKDIEEAYAEKADDAMAFRHLFRQAPGIFAVLEGAELRFSFANDSFQSFAPDRMFLGRPFFEVLPELKDQGVPELADMVLNGRGTVIGETVRLELRPAANDDPALERYFDFSFSPMTDNTGAVVGLFFQGADRTQSMQTMLRHRILVDELNHRVKNTLSTVQAMARQSFRSATDPEQARYAFEARIMALSQAHNILSARRWESAGLTTLLHHELADYPAHRLSISGPNVLLSSKTTIALAIVIHELATNAVRFGAFAGDEGALSIEWTSENGHEGRVLRFTWTERVPHPNTQDIKPGYGIRVLRRIIEGELDGMLSLTMEKTGFICHFEIMLRGSGDIEASVA